MAAFRQEIDELVAEVTGSAHAGEAWPNRVEHIACEALDLVGAAVKAVDETNRDADLAALSVELEAAATLVVGKLLAKRPLIARGVKAGIPFIVGPALEQAANYAKGLPTFFGAHVTPWLARVERIGARGRTALS